MIIKNVKIEKFRAFESASFSLGKCITAISGRNATQKTTLLGMIGQPFTISKDNPMYGCKTIDGYNFRSQFKEKFKISPKNSKYLQSMMLSVSINGNLNCIMEFMNKIIMPSRALPAGNQDKRQLLGFGMLKVAHGALVISSFLFTF